ncbi:hypothetical protein DP51_3410 [Burkholderia pseudomallei]|nr:hypothetical protein DP51_3410 [Burkholderia pseudomallei]
MLKTPMPTQHELEMVTLEELVPKDHLLRQIDAAVDFEFIRAKWRICIARTTGGRRSIPW